MNGQFVQPLFPALAISWHHSCRPVSPCLRGRWPDSRAKHHSIKPENERSDDQYLGTHCDKPFFCLESVYRVSGTILPHLSDPCYPDWPLAHIPDLTWDQRRADASPREGMPQRALSSTTTWTTRSKAWAGALRPGPQHHAPDAVRCHLWQRALQRASLHSLARQSVERPAMKEVFGRLSPWPRRSTATER